MAAGLNESCLQKVVLDNFDEDFCLVKNCYAELKIMRKNNYINASDLCTKHGKRFSTWRQLIYAQKLIKVIEIQAKLGEGDAIIRIKGPRGVLGFYVHQELIYHIALWLAKDIAYIVLRLLNNYHVINGAPDKTLILVSPNSKVMCPFTILSKCYYGKDCKYIHGDKCEICGLYLLHPTNREYRTNHIKTCPEARKTLPTYLRSMNKRCGICLEVVYEKHLNEQYFGLLPTCSHTFCAECITLWRDNQKNTCPECRTPFDQIVPCRFWVDDADEKKTIVKRYKTEKKEENAGSSYVISSNNIFLMWLL